MQAPCNDSDSPGSESTGQSYPPRICRICLDTVLPTVQPSQFLQKPRVVYESTDPELGRLLRPCKCKGSSRYVHEGCLQSWRHADPAYGRRNFWQCPTCGFQYRLERLTWARWISSAAAQILLTLAILLFTIFLLGFVADPIIDLYLGPVDDIYDELDENKPWLEHLLKGVTALGFVSFFRAIFAFSPLHWNMRGSGVITGGRNTGRNRVSSLSWLVILIGIGSFLWVCWDDASTRPNTNMLSRVSTKVSGLGVDEPSNERVKESWTYL